LEPAERLALNAAMARLAEGDRSAFSVVFDTLWPLLSGFAKRLSPNRSDAEDAAQQALLKIFEHAHRYDPTQDVAAWALAITANECHAVFRKRRRAEPLDAASQTLPAPGASPEVAVIERDTIELAAEVLGTLRAEDAATLSAAWRGERPAIAPTTFRKRVQRATERLRAAWRSRHGTP
jgi:RNA polymerase sigma-70 factor (ECF subfamily)